MACSFLILTSHNIFGIGGNNGCSKFSYGNFFKIMDNKKTVFLMVVLSAGNICSMFYPAFAWILLLSSFYIYPHIIGDHQAMGQLNWSNFVKMALVISL